MARSVPEWVATHDDQAVPKHVKLRIFSGWTGADSIEARFLKKVIPEPTCGCWLWTGACTQTGYGHILAGDKYEKAHRLSYRLYVGSIPAGMGVCHRCDTPQCVNPEHLFLGMPQQNIDDKLAKGRSRNGVTLGSNNHFAILSEEDVIFIRSQPRFYGYRAALAKRFGVGESAISALRSGRTWGHL